MTLLLAFLLDALLGEPKAIWNRISHPAVLMGRFVGWADQNFNNGTAKKLKGAALAISICLLSIVLGGLIHILPDLGLMELAVVTVLLAQRSLVEHVSNVASELSNELIKGRQSVALIVGRDTKQMDATDVSRAAIESAAENFSDGVVAPAFWYLLGGLPGIIAYKFINTADSMIGHLTDEHRDFGWAAAKLDDVMNWVPARLTGGLICLQSGSGEAWRVMRTDARKHRSPNAGWPEAAMAASLGIALSGPRSYEGIRTSYPYVNDSGRHDLTEHDINQAVVILWQSWRIIVAVIALVALLRVIF